MSEIKPCPFCGNDGSGPVEDDLHVVHMQNEWHPSYDCYSVQCDKCTATMGYSESEEEAIARWNERAPANVIVADGYAIVPIEPTAAMCDAGRRAMCDTLSFAKERLERQRDGYVAMIAAALPLTTKDTPHAS